MTHIEKELAELKETVRILYAVVIEGKSYTPGEAEYWRAIDALAEGNTAPLVEFRKRGGVIPVRKESC